MYNIMMYTKQAKFSISISPWFCFDVQVVLLILVLLLNLTPVVSELVIKLHKNNIKIVWIMLTYTSYSSISTIWQQITTFLNSSCIKQDLTRFFQFFGCFCSTFKSCGIKTCPHWLPWALVFSVLVTATPAISRPWWRNWKLWREGGRWSAILVHSKKPRHVKNSEEFNKICRFLGRNLMMKVYTCKMTG